MANNYKIVIHFDGTNYKGWQYQDPILKTIQGSLLAALKIIAKKNVVITGSSRTDAGVHSTGLVANFHLKIAIAADSLKKALNSLLSEDIRIMSCQRVDRSFNARFNACSKTYVYRIFTGADLSPFSSKYVIHIPYLLEKRKMKKAARYFVGEKNFSSFTSDEPQKNRIRTITKFKIKISKEQIIFTIQGKSFLRYMVRNIVGTIIDIGRKKINIKDLPEIFKAKDRRRAGQTAPAKGLTLTKVEYDNF